MLAKKGELSVSSFSLLQNFDSYVNQVNPLNTKYNVNIIIHPVIRSASKKTRRHRRPILAYYNYYYCYILLLLFLLLLLLLLFLLLLLQIGVL